MALPFRSSLWPLVHLRTPSPNSVPVRFFSPRRARHRRPTGQGPAPRSERYNSGAGASTPPCVLWWQGKTATVLPLLIIAKERDKATRGAARRLRAAGRAALSRLAEAEGDGESTRSTSGRALAERVRCAPGTAGFT